MSSDAKRYMLYDCSKVKYEPPEEPLVYAPTVQTLADTSIWGNFVWYNPSSGNYVESIHTKRPYGYFADNFGRYPAISCFDHHHTGMGYFGQRMLLYYPFD